jgi:hypothetical protein
MGEESIIAFELFLAFDIKKMGLWCCNFNLIFEKVWKEESSMLSLMLDLKVRPRQGHF